MVLSGHGESSFVLLERYAFRNGPRLQHVVHLEAKIVVQVTRSMFLDNKAAPAALPATSRNNWLRLGCFIEVSFCSVRFQSFTALRAVHALSLEITSQFRGESLDLVE